MTTSIVPGVVAIVKVSKEPVYILADIEIKETLPYTDKPSLEKGFVVRRPVQTTDGVDYRTETFLARELQSKESAIQDEIHDALYFQEQRTAAENSVRGGKKESSVN